MIVLFALIVSTTNPNTKIKAYQLHRKAFIFMIISPRNVISKNKQSIRKPFFP